MELAASRLPTGKHHRLPQVAFPQPSEEALPPLTGRETEAQGDAPFNAQAVPESSMRKVSRYLLRNIYSILNIRALIGNNGSQPLFSAYDLMGVGRSRRLPPSFGEGSWALNLQLRWSPMPHLFLDT